MEFQFDITNHGLRFWFRFRCEWDFFSKLFRNNLPRTWMKIQLNSSHFAVSILFSVARSIALSLLTLISATQRVVGSSKKKNRVIKPIETDFGRIGFKVSHSNGISLVCHLARLISDAIKGKAGACAIFNAPCDPMLSTVRFSILNFNSTLITRPHNILHFFHSQFELDNCTMR